jgi:hypothetical protein
VITVGFCGQARRGLRALKQMPRDHSGQWSGRTRFPPLSRGMNSRMTASPTGGNTVWLRPSPAKPPQRTVQAVRPKVCLVRQLPSRLKRSLSKTEP